MESKFTDILYVEPSFWNGVGRALDLRGRLTRYNRSSSPREADELALRADTKAVSADIEGILETVATPALADPKREIHP